MSCLNKLWKGWVRACTAVNRFFSFLFTHWTEITWNNPIKIIVIGIIISLVFMTGFLRFNELKHTERLYFPEKSSTKDTLDRTEKSFPHKVKPDEWILSMADHKGSVLNVKALNFALEIHNYITTQTDIHKSCYKTNENCIYLNILELFNYNETLLTSDEEIRRILHEAFQVRLWIVF